MRHDEVARAAVKHGFDFNGIANGRELLSKLHGSHRNYNAYMTTWLEDWALSNPNYTPEMAFDFVKDKLIPELNNIVDYAIENNMKLNDILR